MTISWHSISISLTAGGSVIFKGYFSTEDIFGNDEIQNFYYVNNNQYVDILLRELGDFNSDNLFVNNNFTSGGTNILSVIPYMNTTYNTPYKLQFYFDDPYNIISYNPTNTYDDGWVDSDTNFTFTFTSISGLPTLSPPPPPFFSMRSLFTNNAQVYYKSNSLSTGSGGSGVRNSSHKKHRT